MTPSASQSIAVGQGKARKTVRVATGAAGLAAFVVLGVLGSCLPSASSSETVVEAGSGDGAGKDTYARPVAPTMELGASATWAPPQAAGAATTSSTLASPTLKAKPFGGGKVTQWS